MQKKITLTVKLLLLIISLSTLSFSSKEEERRVLYTSSLTGFFGEDIGLTKRNKDSVSEATINKKEKHKINSSVNFMAISTCFEDKISSDNTDAVWPFDGDFIDEDEGNNLALQSGTTGVTFNTTDVAIAGGSAAVFDGTGGLENKSTDSNFMSQGFQFLTMGFWLKPDDVITNNIVEIIYEEGGENNGFAIIKNTDGNIQVSLKRGVGTLTQVGIVNYPKDGEWHHFAFTFDKGVVTTYLDGVIAEVNTNFADDRHFAITTHPNEGGFGNIFGESIYKSAGFARGPYKGKIDEAFYSYKTISYPPDLNLKPIISGPDLFKYVQCVSGEPLSSNISCPDDAFQVSEDNWYSINLSLNGFTQATVIGESYELNAIGFNETDNLVYSMQRATNNLVITEINQNITGGYEIENHLIGAIEGLPDVPYNAGDVYDNHLYIKPTNNATSSNNRIYKINIDATSTNYLNLVETIRLSEGIKVADFVIDQATGMFFAVSIEKDALTVNLDNGDVSNSGIIDYPSGDPSLTSPREPIFGAMFMDAGGILYGINNRTGIIYRLNFDAVAPNKKYEEFSRSIATGSNDGFRCKNAVISLDFGDAPSSYGTLLENNGPRHLISGYNAISNTSSLSLGTLIDSELDGINSTTDADGDNSEGVNDEDAFTIPVEKIEILKPTSYTVDIPYVNTTGSDAIIYAWVDFDGNGTFDDNEEFTSTTATAGGSTASLTWTFPRDITEGITYVRYRITSDVLTDVTSGGTDDRAMGSASNGEVEDYQIEITSCSTFVSTPTATVTQPTCGVPNGTIVFKEQPNPNVEYSIDGINFQTNRTFTVAPNTSHTLTARSTTESSCSLNGIKEITIDAVPSPPAIPTLASTTQPTCDVPSGTIVFNTQTGVEYSIDGTTFYEDPDADEFKGLRSGDYILTVRSTTDTTCTRSGGSVVTIDEEPTRPSIAIDVKITQPTCEIRKGTIELSLPSVSTAPVTGDIEYSINGMDFQRERIFTNVDPDTYRLIVRRISDTSCVDIREEIIVLDPPKEPTANRAVTQPTCAVPTGSIIFETQTGVEYSIDGMTFYKDPDADQFKGLKPGDYILTVRGIDDNTCIKTGNATINAEPIAPSSLNANVIQPSCIVTTGTIVFDTQTGVEYGINGKFQTNETFSGLTPGDYTLTLAVRNSDDSTCVYEETLNVTINNPTSGGISEIDTEAIWSFDNTISDTKGANNPDASSSITYSTDNVAGGSSLVFDGTTRMSFDNDGGTFFQAITNLSVGFWIKSDSNVPSESQILFEEGGNDAGILIYRIANSQTIRVIVKSTTARSAIIVGDFEYPTDNEWHHIAYTYSSGRSVTYLDGMVKRDATRPSQNVIIAHSDTAGFGAPYSETALNVPLGLLAGYEGKMDEAFYSYNTLTETQIREYVLCNINCDTLVPPSASSTDPTCDALGIITVSPTTGSSYMLTNTSTTPISIVSPDTVGGFVYSDLQSGVYSLVETNSIGCVSEATEITIAAPPVVPVIPSAKSYNQPTCSNRLGTITFNTQPDVEYSIGGAFQESEIFTDLDPGDYTLRVRSRLPGGCIIDANTPITINEPPVKPAEPAVSVTQPTCSTLGIIEFVRQTNVEYSIGSGFTPNPIFEGVKEGVYTLAVRSTSLGVRCITNASFIVPINAQPVTPSAPVAVLVTQPTCAVPTGSFQIEGYDVANTYTFTPSVGSISSTGLVTANTDTYTFTLTNAAGCTSASSANIVINAPPDAPVAPVAGLVTQPTCDVATGSFQITGYDVANTYTFTPSVRRISPTGLVTANTGTYRFTLTNAADCTSASSVDIVINKRPVKPKEPNVLRTQPTCSTLGIIEFVRQTNVEYSIGSGFTSNRIFKGVQPGVYTLEVRSTSPRSCITKASFTVSINEQPTLRAPSFSSTDPTCDALGIITVSPTAGSSYVLTNTSTTPVSIVSPDTVGGFVYSNLQSGVYSLVETNSMGCVSEATEITIDAQPELNRPDPDITHPTCAVRSGTIVFDTQADAEYSIDGMNFYEDPDDDEFKNLSPGDYTLTVKSTISDDDSCVKTGLATINDIPRLPSTNASVIQPTCILRTGTIIFDTQVGVEYSINNGVDFQTSEIFTGLDPGDYILTVRDIDDATCFITKTDNVTINNAPETSGSLSEADTEAIWSFDNTISDTKGTNNPDISSSITYSNDNVAGGNSLVFDGTTRMSFDNDGGTFFQAITNLSVGFWIKPDSNVPSNNQILFEEGGNDAGILIYRIANSQIIRVIVKSTTAGSAFIVGQFNYPADNEWHHIAYTYSRGRSVTYLDGMVMLDATNSSLNVIIAHSDTAGFGAPYSETVLNVPLGLLAGYEGKMDEAFYSYNTFTGEEILQYVLCNTDVPIDFGDAPVSYGTSLDGTTQGGARHFILDYDEINNTSALSLGSLIDSELDGFESLADGDNLDGINDEDALTVPLESVSNSLAAYTISIPYNNVTGSDATIYAWLDFDGNGTFDDNEEFTSVTATAGDTLATLTWSLPTDVVVGTTYMRVRITSDILIDAISGNTDDRAIGRASNGEVEDYQIEIIDCTSVVEAGISGGAIEICSTESVSELQLLNNLTGEDAGGSWTTSLGAAVVFPITVAGDYTYTVTGSGACISETDTAVVTITVNPGPITPSAILTQPTCLVPSGTIRFVVQPNVEYSIDGVTFQSSEIFPNLSPSTYNLTVRSTVDTTCSTTSSVPVTINTVPSSPAIPVLASVLQPTCSVSTGTITFVVQSNVEYSVDGVTFQSSEVFPNLSPSTYNLTVRSTMDTTCSTTNSIPVTINGVPSSPARPVLASVLQPTCSVSTGTITFVVQPNVEYSIDGVTFQSSEVFPNLSPSTYNLTVRSTVDTTCSTTSSVPVTINPVPSSPAIPVLASVLQPSCLVVTGSINVTTPVATSTYTLRGIMPVVAAQIGTSFTRLAPGTYGLTETNVDGCTSGATTIVIDNGSVASLRISCPPSIRLECGDSLDIGNTGVPTINGGCGEVNFVFNDSNLIGGCTANTGNFIRTFIATDERGNTISCTQTIIIEDTIAPVFTDDIPESLFVSCNVVPDSITPTVIDNCDTNITMSFLENEIAEECSNNYTLERIWTAIDSCGNESSFTQKVYVQCPITIKNGISLNGDDLNDIFEIEGIECYSNNTVKIFNRWGVLVFEIENYDNENNVFKGFSEGRVTISKNKKLPTGTYFYIINYEYNGNGSPEMLKQSGYLYISNHN